ncbi:hypothetical protein CSHISOI_10693, partial [Colletotrichum shisoi]
MSDAAAPPTFSGTTPTGSLPTGDRIALIIGVSSAFMAVAVLFMALRVYIRGYSLRAWGLDDSMFIWASYLIASVFMYQVSFAFAKATFLLQYRRAFALPSIKLFCDVFSGVLFVIVTAMMIYSGIILDRYTSDGRSPTGTRPDFLAFGYVNSAAHLVTNIIIFILPIALVQKMRLAPMQKVGLIASFGVGILY